MVALLAVLVMQSAPAPPLSIDRLVRVTPGAGVRDNPTAVTAPTGTAVIWEEVREGKYRLMWSRIDSQGQAGGASVLLDTWGHQWGPAVAARGDTTWLASYMADVTQRTGDRDVMLLRFRGLFAEPIDTIRITRDLPGETLPRNDASPAILLPRRGRPVVAWSRGAYHENRPAARAYDDKDILTAEVGERSPHRTRRVTSNRNRGEEMSPALAEWRSPSGDRYLVAYVSRESGGRHELFLAQYDRAWRLRSRRVIARSAEGIVKPSLVVLDGVPWLSWVDNATIDVSVARLSRALRVEARASMRQLLQSTEFSSYGPALAGLSGAQLFEDAGRLAVTFVATMEYRPAESKVRQEVFLAHFQ
jgi:hypothetical protein